MEYRPLDLTIVSAKDLKDVNLFSRMDVYAIAALSNDPRSKQKTPVDREGGKNPTWNFAMKFAIPTGNPNGLVLHIQLKCDRSLGDRDIGEVHIPIKELLDSDTKAAKFVNYQVRTPSGKPKGVLNLSYKIGEKIVPPAPPAHKSHEPVTAYPAAVPGPSYAGAYPPPSAAYPPPSAAYPPPPTAYPYPPQHAYPAAGHGYGAPPPPQQPGYGYGYPPPPQQGYGYGYPPPPMVVQPPQKPKKNNMGLGLGAGLLGGALGGLLIGDMISDSADTYESGYDAGFDDGGGFDF